MMSKESASEQELSYSAPALILEGLIHDTGTLLQRHHGGGKSSQAARQHVPGQYRRAKRAIRLIPAQTFRNA